MIPKTFTAVGKTAQIALDGYEGNNPRRWIITVTFPELSSEEAQALLEDVGTPVIWRTERQCTDLAPQSVRSLCAAAQYLGREPGLLRKEMLDVRVG